MQIESTWKNCLRFCAFLSILPKGGKWHDTSHPQFLGVPMCLPFLLAAPRNEQEWQAHRDAARSGMTHESAKSFDALFAGC